MHSSSGRSNDITLRLDLSTGLRKLIIVVCLFMPSSSVALFLWLTSPKLKPPRSLIRGDLRAFRHQNPPTTMLLMLGLGSSNYQMHQNCSFSSAAGLGDRLLCFDIELPSASIRSMPATFDFGFVRASGHEMTKLSQRLFELGALLGPVQYEENTICLSPAIVDDNVETTSRGASLHV